MSRSQQLSLADIQAAYRLVVEVRERCADPVGWKSFLLAGICHLTGGRSGFACEAPIRLDPNNVGMRNVVEFGWDSPRQRQVCTDFIQDQRVAADPSIPALIACTGQSVSLLRDQMVDNAAWYGSDHVNVMRRAADSDAFVMSQQMLPELGIKQFMLISRPWREKPFEQRQRRIVRLIHEELGRLWSHDLQKQRDNPINALPPRLRQALELLRRGDSEKQVAAKLSISRHGAHHLIRRLHRELGVATRGELLALAAARQTKGFVISSPPN